MQNKNEITLEKHGAIMLLDIEGDITAFSEPFLNDAYKRASDEGASRILLKVGEDAYINSGGIAVLIQVLAQTKRNNQNIGITGLSDHFKKIFNMVGITKFATIHSSVEEGLAALSAD
jgi:anti-anti-sigma factor